MTIFTNLIIVGTIILSLYIVSKLGLKWLVKSIVFGLGGAAAGFVVGYLIVKWICTGLPSDMLCGVSAAVMVMPIAILGGLAVGIFISVRISKPKNK